LYVLNSLLPAFYYVSLRHQRVSLWHNAITFC